MKRISILTVASLFILTAVTSATAQWTKASATFHASYFYPWNQDSVFAISDGKLYLSPDQGANWTQSLVAPEVKSIVSSANGILYAATNNQIFRSTNSGANWISLTTTGKPPAVTSFFARSISGTTDELFLGAKDGMYKTNSDALDWVAVSEEVNVQEFVATGDKLYARSPLSILRSSDGGSTWKIVDSTTVAFSGLAVSGNNAFAMISTPPSGTVDHSNDGGDNWLGPLLFSFGSASFQKMAVNAWGDVYICGGIRSDVNPDSITQGYVYRWLNGSQGWEFYNSGLPTVDLVGLGFGYKGRVYVSTDSAGIYKTTEALQSVKRNNIEAEISECFPNPSLGSFALDINSTASKSASVSLFDLQGVQQTATKFYTLLPGRNMVSIDNNDLSNGTYLCRIQVDGIVSARFVTISK